MRPPGGMGRFDYLRAHPEEARLFDAMMANFPDNRHAAVAGTYDFSGAGLIADIGGGNGAMLRHILARFPGPRGLVFDREDVVRSIPPNELMEGRIAVAGGSFFEGVPTGADANMLIRVLHDWPDEDCLRILRACRAAMGPEALLLIGEQILDPDPAHGRPTGYLTDMQMMAMFGSARTDGGGVPQPAGPVRLRAPTHHPDGIARLDLGSCGSVARRRHSWPTSSVSMSRRLSATRPHYTRPHLVVTTASKF